MAKRVAALLMAIMLSMSARAQGVYVIQTSGIAAMVDAGGAEIIHNGAFETIFELKTDALYAAGSPGEYGLYDDKGARLNDETYDMLEVVGDVVLCRQGGLCGAMDLRGEVLIAPVWAQLTYAGDGAFLALEGEIYDDQPDEIISVDVSGARVNTGSYTADGLRPFCDGRMAFTLSDGGSGYVDALGRQVIPPEWKYAGDFADGVAIVSGDAGMGLIDAQGSVLVAEDYGWMRRGDGMITAKTDDGRLDVFSPDGREILYAIEPVESAEVCGGCVVARDSEAARLYDRSGACLNEASPAALFFPGLDSQVIAADGEWGEPCQRLLNPDGSAVDGAWQALLPLCGERYASMAFDLNRYEEDARCALINAMGEELLPAEYREILPAGDDRLVLVTEDSVIFADLDGKPLREWEITETAASTAEAGA